MKILSVAKARKAALAGALTVAGAGFGLVAAMGEAQAQFFYPRGYYYEPDYDEDFRPPGYVGRERLVPAPVTPYYERPYGRAALIEPREVVDIAQSEYGLRMVGRPRLQGRVYRIEGTDRSGNRVRLTVSAVQGTILNAERIGTSAIVQPPQAPRRQEPSLSGREPAPPVGAPQKPRAPAPQEQKPREAALPPKIEPKARPLPQIQPQAPQAQTPAPVPAAKPEQPAAVAPTPTPPTTEQKPAQQSGAAQAAAPAPRVVLPNPMEASKMPTLVEPAPLDDAKPKSSAPPSTEPTPYVPPAPLD